MPRRKLWLSKADREWLAWIDTTFDAAFSLVLTSDRGPNPERDRQWARMVFIASATERPDHDRAVNAMTETFYAETPPDSDALLEGTSQMREEWNARAPRS
jgi:hypothetical protein